jgi:hypothetical protein
LPRGLRRIIEKLVDQNPWQGPEKSAAQASTFGGIFNEDNARAALRRAYRMCRIWARNTSAGAGQNGQDRRLE